MTTQSFLTEIKETINDIFPNSFANARLTTNLGNCIWIDFTIGKDKSEYSNGICQNDIAKQCFVIWEPLTKEGELKEELILEKHSTGFYVNPPIDSYLAMSHHKVSFRKVKGNNDKILNGVKKYFLKLKKELQENEANLYNYNLKDKF